MTSNLLRCARTWSVQLHHFILLDAGGRHGPPTETISMVCSYGLVIKSSHPTVLHLHTRTYNFRTPLLRAMTVQGIVPTGTYTIRNASTNEYVVVQGPPKAATLVGSSDGSAENAAVRRSYRSCERGIKANLNIM